PLFSALEVEVDVAWFQPQSEYRTTQYLQNWIKFWFDDELRLKAAKDFQIARLRRIEDEWVSGRYLKTVRFDVHEQRVKAALAGSKAELMSAHDTQAILTAEARLTKKLYSMAAEAVGYGEFTRERRGTGADAANQFLDHGN